MGSSTLLSLRSSTWALLAAAGLLLAAPGSQAASIAVLFDGPTSAGQHYGLSASMASAAKAAGVEVLTPPLESSRNKLLVVDQDLESLSLGPSDLIAPFEASSSWTVENVSDTSYSDIVYLVFTTADSRDLVLSTGTVTADYDESQVGLRIDGANGWVLLQTSVAGLGTLYYPAVRLGPLGIGAQTQVDVHYYLNQLLSYQDGSDTYVPLPKLRIAMAVVPIPEPGTALLLATGLTLLAARARTRS